MVMLTDVVDDPRRLDCSERQCNGAVRLEWKIPVYRMLTSLVYAVSFPLLLPPDDFGVAQPRVID